ncbi:plasmid replication, integration and excision activator [Streptosporangium sp. NPDC023615]|uniref:plasmid replication, integration and excision activator n=1 Tax=Streptosporangium sp. NPDC023615 TaxID=3154794 RepID=UPI0034166F0F
MALQGRIPVRFEDVFPYGCFVVGPVTPVNDYDASTPGKPVPSRDKVSGMPEWSVPVLDADPEARAANKTIPIKISAPEMPVLPELPPEMAALGLSFIPVVFDGMTVTPWISNERIAYSYRATGVRPVSPPVKATPKGRDPINP